MSSWASAFAPPYWLPVWTKWSTDETFRCSPYLFLEDQSFEVRLVEPSWPKFEPSREGKPLLGGTIIEKAQHANDVLVLGTFCNGERQKLVFRGPDARLVYQLPRADRGSDFALSPDGSLLAFKSRVMDVSIVETASSALPRAVATAARLHNGLIVNLIEDPFTLTIGVGDFVHTFSLEIGKFKHTLRRGRPPTRAKLAPINCASYDSARFPHKEMASSTYLSAVVDRLGQVLLMFGSDVLIAFLIRRDRAAAITHDGTCWGDVTLLGCPATPGAEEKLADELTTLGGRSR